MTKSERDELNILKRVISVENKALIAVDAFCSHTLQYLVTERKRIELVIAFKNAAGTDATDNIHEIEDEITDYFNTCHICPGGRNNDNS